MVRNTIFLIASPAIKRAARVPHFYSIFAQLFLHEFRQEANVRRLVGVGVFGDLPRIQRPTGIEILIGFLIWLAFGRVGGCGAATGIWAAGGAVCVPIVAGVWAAG